MSFLPEQVTTERKDAKNRGDLLVEICGMEEKETLVLLGSETPAQRRALYYMARTNLGEENRITKLILSTL